MQTRRTLLRLSLGLVSLTGAVPFAQAWALAPEAAARFIDETAKRMIAVINSGGAAAQKQAALQQIIDSAVAVDEIGRFCLGRFWRTATPAERQRYLALFHHVLLNSITGHLGEYKGITYTIGRAVPGEGGIEVPSTMNRPGQTPANLTWVVADVGGSPKIIDVIAEGTSLRVTQRSDYDSFLSRHNGSVTALVEALQRQVSQSG